MRIISTFFANQFLKLTEVGRIDDEHLTSPMAHLIASAPLFTTIVLHFNLSRSLSITSFETG